MEIWTKKDGNFVVEISYKIVYNKVFKMLGPKSKMILEILLVI